ncbi:MAG TPA: glycosyltransferase family 39 protein [Chloroflexota bacterium]|nr:glycosyltransferase family 39 protein [Chloroflexota bacterium]
MLASCPPAAPSRATRGPALFRPRLFRFAATGTAASLVQLAGLHVGLALGWAPLLANAAALLVATQVNFGLSAGFTWRDRRSPQAAGAALARQWARFHLAMASTAALNWAVFTGARAALPPSVAAALGILAAAGANFLLGDRIVFRPAGAPPRVQQRAALPCPTPTDRLPGTSGAEQASAGVPAGHHGVAAPGAPRWERPALSGVLALAAVLYGWGITREGWGNPYYAAAVRSMLASWSNFLFGAFDPAGFITVDKPPLALWLQALAARLLGFQGTSLLLPQVVEGVLTVLALHWAVRRSHGPLAALLAALILALTPVSVAINRTNLPDALLVLLLVGAGGCLLVAVESGRLRPLLASAALVGLAFTTKMLQAYLVVPACALTYLVAAPGTLRRRLGHLLAFGTLLAAVSAAWPLAVALTPPEARPYIGGSQTNSAFELALGYNGLGRLWGQGPGGPPDAPPPAGAPPGAVGDTLPPPPGAALSSGGPPPGPGGGFGGPPGWLRLFNAEVGDQISWLLPLAALGLAVGLASRGRRPRTDGPRAACLLWGGWLVAHAVVFSCMRGIFHPYYTAALAPAIAALAGTGLATLWDAYRQRTWAGRLLPLALGLGAGWPAVLVARGGWHPWLGSVIAGGALLAGGGLIAAHCGRRRTIGVAAFGLGMAALLLGPAAWGVATLQQPALAMNPQAGPRAAGGLPFGPPPGAGLGPGLGVPVAGNPPLPPGLPPGPPGAPPDATSPGLIAYLQAHRDGATYLVATTGSMAAAPLILATGEPVLAMGGFAGADPVPTTAQLAALVRAGALRFVLLGGPPGAGPGGHADRQAWVQAHCQLVEATAYGGTPSARPFGPPPGQLYDCAPSRDQS